MSGETNVQPGKLPQYARDWDDNASKIDLISRQSERLEFPFPAGIFSGVAEIYNQVCREVSQLCGQGQAQMQQIADAILSSYRRYEDTENENIRKITSVDDTSGHQAP